MQGVGEPEKLEIVLVEIAVGSGATLGSVQTSVLPTLGDHNHSATVEGASAMDPMLTRNVAGDVVIFYRKVQDPHFKFVQNKETSTVQHDIASLGFGENGTCSPTQNPVPMLPIQSPAGTSSPLKYETSLTNSVLNVYPGVLCARVRMAGESAFGEEMVVSEPYVQQTGGGIASEDWNAFQARCKKLGDYGYLQSQFVHPSTSLLWLSDRPNPSTLLPAEIDAVYPQAWHPAWPAAVQVGPRIENPSGATTVPVLLAWTFVAPPSQFERFGSHEGLTGGSGTLALQYDQALTTWEQPAVSFTYKNVSGVAEVQDTADHIAHWQQRWSLHTEKGRTAVGGQRPTVKETPGASDRALLYSPKTGYEPRRGLFSPDSTLRLTAWLRASGNTTKIAYEWEKASAGTGSAVLVMPKETGQPAGDFSTTDGRVRLVAVVPWVRNVSGVPAGRVVWQADDDIWVAEVQYVTPAATQVVRVTPSAQRTGDKGRFPSLLTEVSVTGDLLAWTYDGQIHAVRLAQVP